MKGTLKRIEKGLIENISPNAPDYEGFVKGVKGYVFMRAWHKKISSDLNIQIEKIDDSWLENKFNATKFAKWFQQDNQNKES
jgi:hypothetical protein